MLHEGMVETIPAPGRRSQMGALMTSKGDERPLLTLILFPFRLICLLGDLVALLVVLAVGLGLIGLILLLLWSLIAHWP